MAKKSGALSGRNCMETIGIDCYYPYSSSNRELHSRSVSSVHEDILNMSPQLSHHNPIIQLQRRLQDWNSMCPLEMAPGRSSTNSMASISTPVPKPAAELVKEIAALELEVVHMERYLLSLYRTAFDQYLASSPASTNHASRLPLECHAGSLKQNDKVRLEHESSHASNSNHMDFLLNQSPTCEKMELKCADNYKDIMSSPARKLAAVSDNSCGPYTSDDPKYDMLKPISGHRSLADHLGASIADLMPETPCRLSEDIVRCISAIYCKLANPSLQQIDLFSSPTPSVSSSSTFSPQDPCDNWSPGCHYEAAASPYQFDSPKEKQSPYSGMLEIPKIFVDGDRFAYASKMLNIFRSLIRRLEKINPTKMVHSEQLAFWINIHNALVMHALLAYGLHQNQMKSTFSILRAAYDVGGNSVNAYVIQSSILGCLPQRSTLGLRSLFSPAKKFMKRSGKHPYALDHTEPLSHFALCLGAYSDPPVRVYTAKGISQELKLAKEEYIQANVSIQKETKIILPKILYYYAKDASMQLSELIEMVHDCMPGAQQKAIQGCLRRKLDKCVEWSQYKASFRYLVHSDLAKQLEHIPSYL